MGLVADPSGSPGRLQADSIAVGSAVSAFTLSDIPSMQHLVSPDSYIHQHSTVIMLCARTCIMQSDSEIKGCSGAFRQKLDKVLMCLQVGTSQLGMELAASLSMAELSLMRTFHVGILLVPFVHCCHTDVTSISLVRF